MVSRNPKVFLWPKANTTPSEKPLQFVKLRHPRTRKSAMFLLNSKSDLQEILNFVDGHRSWFLENHVFSEKFSMRICTPVNKLFLLLPYLEQSKNFTPIPDLIVDEDFPDNHLVFDEDMDLSCIADKKEAGSLTVYRWNKEKTLVWLQKKTEDVASTLKTKNIDISTGNFSVNFKEADTLTDDDYKRYAHGIVSEYISSDLSQELRTAFGFKEHPQTESTPNKRGSDEQKHEPQSKRMKQASPEEPAEDYSKYGLKGQTKGKVETSKMTPAQKKLMNSSKEGIQSVLNFFAKRN